MCCFCRTVTTSKPEFVAHLSSHLDYKPIACQHCNNNFANEIDFQFHGQQHPQLETIKYAMARHRYYDSWVEQLAAAISNDDTFSLDFIDCCPVCRTFYDAQNPTSSAIGNENESAVNFERPSSRNLFQFYIFNQIKYTQIRHVYQHFCYFPYRCKICHGKNENVCFPLLDEGCAAHLKKHNIRHLCPTNIFDYIDRLNIFLLDDLLTSHNLTDTSFRRIDCNRCLRTN